MMGAKKVMQWKEMEIKEKTRHIDLLSQCKPISVGFYEDKRSVYWDNRIPSKDYSKTTEFMVTPRLNQLSHHKQLSSHYIGDRPTPIWTIHPAALTTTSTPRLQELATPKTLHTDYQPPKPVRTQITRRALSANATPRLCQLALHKTYRSLPIKPNSEWDWSQWSSDVSPAALRAKPRPHTDELAVPKSLNSAYQPPKSVQWPISHAVLQYNASDRLSKLAQHKQVPSYQKDYNPRAWMVSRAALIAQTSPCIDNLAKPLPRKCRQKKT